MTGWVELVGQQPNPEDPIFPDEHGGLTRPRSADLIRIDLEAACCATTYGDHPIDFHATRRSFSTWLDANGVAGDLIDRMMGHAGRTVRQRHYTAGDLEAMLRAVETIKLDLAPKEGEVRGLVSLASGTPANDQPCTLPAKFPALRENSARGGCFDRRNLLGKTRLLPP